MSWWFLAVGLLPLAATVFWMERALLKFSAFP
jgi:hypothetical protein